MDLVAGNHDFRSRKVTSLPIIYMVHGRWYPAQLPGAEVPDAPHSAGARIAEDWGSGNIHNALGNGSRCVHYDDVLREVMEAVAKRVVTDSVRRGVGPIIGGRYCAQEVEEGEMQRSLRDVIH